MQRGIRTEIEPKKRKNKGRKERNVKTSIVGTLDFRRGATRMDGIGEESGARVYTAGHNSFLKAMQSGCYSPSHGSGSLIIEAPFLFKPKPRFAGEKSFNPVVALS